MKYFLTLVLCLAMVGLVFAVNTGNVTQTGDDNQATITQDGSNNKGYITQNSTPNNPTGSASGNDAEISQNDGNDNWASIEQIGDNWYLPSASITQKGSENSGKIFMKGAYNKASINQQGSNNEAEHIFECQYGFGGTWNIGKIDQIGSENKAYQWMKIDGGYGGWVTGNYLDIYQDGNRNNATQDLNPGIVSFSNRQHNIMHIFQDGDENQATQNIAGYRSDNNRASIDQLGSGNVATQDIQAIQDYPGAGNTADIDQDGNGNEAGQYQEGDENYASTWQDGDWNVAKLNQSGGGTSNILQNGSSNRVEGYDVIDTDPATTGDEWAKFSGSDMDVNQQGDGNVAEVDASGTVDIDQNGLDHAVATGSGNITINQTADYNTAFVVNDEGKSNVDQITNNYNQVWLDKQHSQGDVDIFQDGDYNEVFGLAGDFGLPTWATFTGNDGDPLTLDLDVDQVGSGNLLRLDANGKVTVNQNGSSNMAYVSQQ